MSRLARMVISAPMLLLVLSLTTPVTAGAGGVTVRDSDFDPQVRTLHAPDSINAWLWDGSVMLSHNVRQDKRLFRSGAPTDVPGTTYQRRFSAGTFPYYCEVHGSPGAGMFGKVRVPVRIESTGDPGVISVYWASGSTNTGKAFDVKYRVDGGAWITWKTDVKRTAARFGRNDRPVAVEVGHTYEVKARSQKRADTPTRVSGWSPPGSYEIV